MKYKLSYLALLTSILLLPACGGGGGNLLDDNTDRDTLTPPPGEEDDSDRPRPPENEPTLTSEGYYIYDLSGNEKLLRGINLNYGADPAARIGGVTAIGETGANVIRVKITKDTTEDELDGALAKALDAGMVAVVSLVDAEQLACRDENTVLLNAVDDLWLDKWIAVLAQDRYQGNVMINIADGWGPANIFNSSSLGYAAYIDTYKALIRKFRKAGFKLPLVIDAPGCGADFNAFLAGRAKELLAADDENNIVLSVHATGIKWDTSDEIISAVTQLNNEKVPFVVSAFDGSEVGDFPVNHLDIMKQSRGNTALRLDLPWVSSDDKAAYSIQLDEAIDLAGGAAFSVKAYLNRLLLEFKPDGGRYIQTGTVAIAPYLKDSDGNMMRVGMTDAKEIREVTWNTLHYDLPKEAIDPETLLNGSTEFNISSVKEIGFQILANGKPASVKGEIKLDDLMLFPGAPPLYTENFDAGSGNWTAAWGETVVGQADGALTVMPASGDLAVNVPVSSMPSVDFTKTLTLKMRIFLPVSYTGSLWMKAFGKFGSDWSIWADSGIPTGDLIPGQWSEIKTTIDLGANNADLSTPQVFGFQLGGYAMPQTEPFLVDSVVIEDPNARPTKIVTATQFKSTFTSGVDSIEPTVNDGVNWAGHAVTTVVQAEGALVVTPDVSTGTSLGLIKSDIHGVQEVNLSAPLTIKMKVWVPESYTDADSEKPLSVHIYFMDGENWRWFENNNAESSFGPYSGFVAGQWNDVEMTLTPEDITSTTSGFNLALVPNGFGIIFDNIGGLSGGSLKIDDLEFVGATVVDDTQPIYSNDFSTPAQFNTIATDPSLSTFDNGSLTSAVTVGWKIAPFGWIANTWIGSGEGSEALDISTSGDSVELTPRGEEIVNGEDGIVATSVK